MNFWSKVFSLNKIWTKIDARVNAISVFTNFPAIAKDGPEQRERAKKYKNVKLIDSMKDGGVLYC